MQKNKILTNISFIIQGEVYPHINLQIAEIRKHFPQAAVIVSYCGECGVKIEGADAVVSSQDPGFFYYSRRPGENLNNVNRQIVNTLAGLRACKTEYAFKLRSDFFITGNDFLDYFNKFPLAENDYKVFDHKILACNYFTRNPQDNRPYPFHISDLAFFGKTKDLINLFDIPLMTEEEAYFSFNTPISNKYVPEQYIFINCLKKNGKKAELELYNQATPENIEDTERYFASNFVLLSFEQFNLQCTKKTFDMAIHPNSFITCYTHYDWLKLYKKWVNPAVELPERDEERDKLNKFYKTYRKYRFFANIIALPFRTKEKRKKVRNGILEYFLERKYK